MFIIIDCYLVLHHKYEINVTLRFLTLTLLNRNICVHIVDTQYFFQIYERNFLRKVR